MPSADGGVAAGREPKETGRGRRPLRSPDPCFGKGRRPPLAPHRGRRPRRHGSGNPHREDASTRRNTADPEMRTRPDCYRVKRVCPAPNEARPGDELRPERRGLLPVPRRKLRSPRSPRRRPRLRIGMRGGRRLHGRGGGGGATACSAAAVVPPAGPSDALQHVRWPGQLLRRHPGRGPVDGGTGRCRRRPGRRPLLPIGQPLRRAAHRHDLASRGVVRDRRRCPGRHLRPGRHRPDDRKRPSCRATTPGSSSGTTRSPRSGRTTPSSKAVSYAISILYGSSANVFGNTIVRIGPLPLSSLGVGFTFGGVGEVDDHEIANFRDANDFRLSCDISVDSDAGAPTIGANAFRRAARTPTSRPSADPSPGGTDNGGSAADRGRGSAEAPSWGRRRRR